MVLTLVVRHMFFFHSKPSISLEQFSDTPARLQTRIYVDNVGSPNLRTINELVEFEGCFCKTKKNQIKQLYYLSGIKAIEITDREGIQNKSHRINGDINKKTYLYPHFQRYQDYSYVIEWKSSAHLYTTVRRLFYFAKSPSIL